jgi:hypothetical protein
VEITVPIIKTPRQKAYTASNGKVARSNGSGGVSNVRGGSEKIYCSVLINEKNAWDAFPHFKALHRNKAEQ